MRMLRWIMGVSLREHRRSEDIRREAKIVNIREKARENRLRWAGHVWRREAEDPIRRAYEMNVKGKRSRGRQKMRWNDVIQKDLTIRELLKEDAQDRQKWKAKIRPRSPTPHNGME